MCPIVFYGEWLFDVEEGVFHKKAAFEEFETIVCPFLLGFC